MSGRGRYRNHRTRNTEAPPAREPAMSFAADSPVLAVFTAAAARLTERQDRHERLVKLSRDITIESKRIIFLLHSSVSKELTGKTVAEAKQRIQKLIDGPIRSIALELENSPAYLHSKAVTAGFQEFIEARTLCSLIETGQIIKYSDIQKEFTHQIKTEEDERTIVALLPHMDYMLGIADLTGELMRKAINSIASGDNEDCFSICGILRQLYAGFLGVHGPNRGLAQKFSTTRANLYKVEYAVYTLKVRGGEAPPPLLLPPAMDWDHAAHDADVDEGYY